MRPLLLLLIFAIIFINASASDSTHAEKKVYSYLSVNATYFLQQYINLNRSGNTIAPSPFLVEYKLLCKNQGFRFSVGGDFHESKGYVDTNLANIDHDYIFYFRLGYVYQHKLSKHWEYYIGADLISHVSDTFTRANSKQDIVIVNAHNNMIGAGLSFGIQFDINKRIGFYTETAFYYRLQLADYKKSSANFSELDEKSHAIRNNMSFTLPVSLFFYVRL